MSRSIIGTSKKRKAAPQSQYQQEPITTIPYIPIPIVFEILSRVQIKTLLNCRLVCKNWAALISTPEFVELHLSRSPTACLIKRVYQRSINKPLFKGLHLVDPEYLCSLRNNLGFVPEMDLPNVPFTLINSCNGLVCLSQLFFHASSNAAHIYVCNLVLGEYITIPKHPHVRAFDSDKCAFGFSHKTNQYKVVLCTDVNTCLNRPNYPTKTYILGEGSWRSIENAPYCIWNRYFNTFLNGALHWLLFGYSSPFICCFDFVTEQFRAVPGPYEFSPRKDEFSRKMHVGMINANLSLSDCSNCDRIAIWVMKEYGVKKSWSKDIVITHRICDPDFDTYVPIMTMGDGKILVMFRNHSIMLYDPKSEAFVSERKIFGVGLQFRAVAHVPSLISLKDVAKGENLKVHASFIWNYSSFGTYTFICIISLYISLFISLV